MTTQNTLSREQVAEILNISTRTLDRKVAKGAISTIRHKGRILFDKVYIEDLKNNQQKVFSTVINNQSENMPVVQEQYENMLKVFIEQTRKEIEKKDEKINELTYRIGALEERAKNSVPLLETRKNEENLQIQIKKAKASRIAFLIIIIVFTLFVSIYEVVFG